MTATKAWTIRPRLVDRQNRPARAPQRECNGEDQVIVIASAPRPNTPRRRPRTCSRLPGEMVKHKKPRVVAVSSAPQYGLLLDSPELLAGGFDAFGSSFRIDQTFLNSGKKLRRARVVGRADEIPYSGG
jgi:hypothetical protein